MHNVEDYLDIAAELAAAFPRVEDAYQIAALEICEQAAAHPDMPPTEFRLFAATAARNNVRNAQTRQTYEVRRGLAGGCKGSFDSMADVKGDERDRMLRRLECLPSLLRDAAHAKWLENLSWKEMASRFFPREKPRDGIDLVKDLVATARERIRADTAE